MLQMGLVKGVSREFELKGNTSSKQRGWRKLQSRPLHSGKYLHTSSQSDSKPSPYSSPASDACVDAGALFGRDAAAT